jgi:hypothetical protein
VTVLAAVVRQLKGCRKRLQAFLYRWAELPRRHSGGATLLEHAEKMNRHLGNYPQTGFWEMCVAAHRVEPQSRGSISILEAAFFANIKGTSVWRRTKSDELPFLD